MKIQAFSTLGCAVLGSAAFVKRDSPGGKPLTPSVIDQGRLFMEQVAPNIKPIAVDAKPQLRPDAIRKKLLFGPYILPASKALYCSQNFES
jgi:hypothetical protein